MTSAKLCKGRCVGGGGGGGVRGGGGKWGGGQLGAQCNHNTPDQAHDAIKLHHSHYDANILPVSCQKTFKHLHTLTNIPYHWKL